VLPRARGQRIRLAREIEQHGRPDKALYKVMPKGLAALRGWLDAVEDEPAAGRVVFALKLFFCDFAYSRDSACALAAYRAYLIQRLDAYEQLEAQLGDRPRGYSEHVLEHGLRRVRATLDWIDDTTAEISASARTAQV